jgi:hypothetical protein
MDADNIVPDDGSFKTVYCRFSVSRSLLLQEICGQSYCPGKPPELHRAELKELYLICVNLQPVRRSRGAVTAYACCLAKADPSAVKVFSSFASFRGFLGSIRGLNHRTESSDDLRETSGYLAQRTVFDAVDQL